MKTSKPLSVLLSVLTALLVVSGSVAVPLLCRPFYYAHIAPMNLTAYGLPEEQIITAYDEMMDFCLGLSEEFSVGVLAFSRSGFEHFADVRKLFLLDLWVLAISAALLAVLFVYVRRKQVRPYCFRGHGPGFWAAVGLGVSFLTVGGLAALDFDRAFVVFHAIFFPGKENWIFDWREDPIILFLPQDFFRNCAILILALLLVWCVILVSADIFANRVRKKREAEAAAAFQGCAGCPSLQSQIKNGVR